MKKFLLSVVAGMSLTTTSMAQTVPSYVPTNGLVGYWGFDGNAQDYSGNGNHGTVNGATLTADKNGVANKAYNFDGVNDYIQVNNSSSLQGLTSISAFIWININSWYNGYFPVLHKSNGSQHGKYAFLLNTGGGIAHLVPYENGFNYSPWSLNTWIHIGYTIGSGKTNFYVNGQTISSASTGVFPVSSNETLPLIFGMDKPGLTEYTNGKLDDIAIYNRVLTQQEITALYTGCNLNASITTVKANAKAGDNALLTANAADGSATFQWQSNPNNFGWQNIPINLNYSGANTASLTVNNVQLGNHNQPFRVIATSGSCSDTSDVANIQLSDTCLITVHDTLVINRTITGLSAPNNKNTIKVYPNPAKDHVIIHYGNFAMMNGYSVKITNTLGQELFASPINQQTSSVNLSNWINHSLYFVQIIDPQGKTVETRKILIE